jgi:hypothetical protein
VFVFGVSDSRHFCNSPLICAILTATGGRTYVGL